MRCRFRCACPRRRRPVGRRWAGSASHAGTSCRRTTGSGRIRKTSARCRRRLRPRCSRRAARAARRGSSRRPSRATTRSWRRARSRSRRALDASAAASAFLTDTSQPVPQLSVQDDQGQPWAVLEDLLSSDGLARVCVVEIERDGTAFIRFGDGQYGAAPETGASFQATYRVGNGTAGNVGRDTLAHVLPGSPASPRSAIPSPPPAASIRRRWSTSGRSRRPRSGRSCAR